MGIQVKVIADSVGPSGKRITTFELRYHRFIHSEFMTHRAFSRNAASSRAIPIAKMLRRIKAEPALPLSWGTNQKGMQAGAELTGWRRWLAIRVWLLACRVACALSWTLSKLGVHKQVANRLTEPFQYMVTVVTATEWANFFHLRYHKDAQPEFQALAKAMYKVYRESTPTPISAGGWHLPYVDYVRDGDDVCGDLKVSRWTATFWDMLCKISTGRCARTSYVNQDGVRSIRDDIALHNRLVKSAQSGDPGHWSPLEHQAQALEKPEQSGNFVGWKQYRKTYPNECTRDLPELPTR
jgi:hypothetical protein